jgi:hypothetical protein
MHVASVGATAFAACADGSELAIWWFPLLRDSIMYFLSTMAMFVFMLDFKVFDNREKMKKTCVFG